MSLGSIVEYLMVGFGIFIIAAIALEILVYVVGPAIELVIDQITEIFK